MAVVSAVTRRGRLVIHECPHASMLYYYVLEGVSHSPVHPRLASLSKGIVKGRETYHSD